MERPASRMVGAEGEGEVCTRVLQASKMAEGEGEGLCCCRSLSWASVVAAVGEELGLEGTGCWKEEVEVVCLMEVVAEACSCWELVCVRGS